MVTVLDPISRRLALRAAGGGAASLFLAQASNAQEPQPVDRGSVKDSAVRFPSIAAGSEAREDEIEPPLSPKERVGFAVLALGRLSVEQILPAFGQTKKCRLAALVSGSPEKLNALAERYGVPPTSRYTYDTFDKIAQNDDVQVVYIVLPNAMHKEFVSRAAAARKHILCEKPMATSIEDARSMIAATDQAGVKLMIAYRCRYEPHHLELIRRAQGGDLGPIKLIEAVNAQNQGDPSQWRLRKALAGGGALPDIGIYCLNAARAVTGEQPTQVEAQIYSTPGDARFTEVEESITWLMRFPSGTLASLSASYGTHRASRLGVYLDKGGLILENAFPYKGQQLFEVRAEDARDQRSFVQIAAADHFATEMDHMADCVVKNQKPRTPGEEGLRDVVLMDAIYRAANDRKTVYL
jgi:predicted dehydrogenase